MTIVKQLMTNINRAVLNGKKTHFFQRNSYKEDTLFCYSSCIVFQKIFISRNWTSRSERQKKLLVSMIFVFTHTETRMTRELEVSMSTYKFMDLDFWELLSTKCPPDFSLVSNSESTSEIRFEPKCLANMPIQFKFAIQAFFHSSRTIWHFDLPRLYFWP